MALTQRFISNAAAGGGAGTEGDPFTPAEAATHSTTNTGQIYEMLSDSAYTIGALTWGAGTSSAPNVVRGYETTVGDLTDQGRNADGTQDTTNFPAITITGTWVPAPFVIFQNLNITGALSAYLVGTATVDNWRMVSSSVTNTQNNASAGTVQGDNNCGFIDLDLHCSGASHASVLESDSEVRISGCRVRGTSSSDLIDVSYGEVTGCTLWGNANSPIGVVRRTGLTVGTHSTYSGNTFYLCGTCHQFPDVAPTDTVTISHSHATDSSKWIDNLHSATNAIIAIESYNRLRDITTPRTGVESIDGGGEVTTDTGGAETDYEDAANGDFHLISGAPGRDAGLYGQDIGAYQHAAVAGGGGTKLAGFGGGMIG